MMQTKTNKQGLARSRGLFPPCTNTAHDHVQRALINLELFGPGIGAIVISGALLLISVFQQTAHCGTNKGVS
jgi:hypothetical protein